MHTSEQLRERLAHVPAPSLVGIGDNVLDCYLHEDLAYPGGNALNVAAYSRLFFAGTAGFIGIMGDDRFAAHLGRVLDEVGVDRSRVRVAHGANGMAFVALDDEGDRRFVGSNRGGVQHELRLRINEQDHEYIAGFARMHTSVYSSMNSGAGRGRRARHAHLLRLLRRRPARRRHRVGAARRGGLLLRWRTERRRPGRPRRLRARTGSPDRRRDARCSRSDRVRARGADLRRGEGCRSGRCARGG